MVKDFDIKTVESIHRTRDDRSNFFNALIAGGIAGTTVDLVFYPLDTIKTRLQSSQGFLNSGGLRGVYKGLGSVAVGSAPGAALFFTTYEQFKRKIIPNLAPNLSTPVVHMISASLGEVAACLVRVPIEVVKQRQQVSAYGLGTSSLHALRLIIRKGGIKSLYQGFGITISREVPFALLQFPLYESLKLYATERGGFDSPDSLPFYITAGSGSVAGSISAALTTPLDVIKTRIMLSKDVGSVKFRKIIVESYRCEGFKMFWRGVVPRTIWIGFGGAVFLGVYEVSQKHLKKIS
ncbi:mitochondrial carrier protein PET [Phakopsora pachyrhizi]|uniref:Mitochondrial carrier protein PET n=1 Tax=Phakopsora pachyrhizi TaxID=170000 RepID=A0AAV0BLQ2_PHAPC|nr:mitochondrial carrier protein PET [Phakopsora pachyrhizi]CAH7687986.1 mitochondrial carrier protein PET [Phakopsora pachyrhizi]